MKNQRIDIERLVHNKILGLLSEEEEAQLNRWLSQSEKNREDFNRMMKPADLADRYHHYASVDDERAWQKFINANGAKTSDKTKELGAAEVESKIHQTSKHSILKTWLYRVAAVIVLLIVGGGYWYHREYTRVTPPVIPEEVQLAMQQSREGGHQAAEIVTATTPDKEVISNEERVLYHVDEQFAEQLAEARRITTYQDKEYWVTLDDGSLVHLNNNSRLIYPERFGDRRDVILEGEAYFMVARDKSRQFVVHTPMGDVKVYGTEFWMKTPANANTVENTSALSMGDDEGGFLVLVRGSVSFTPSSGKEQMILPGQELSVRNSQLSVNKVDIAPYEAWNEGLFMFDDCPLWKLMDVLDRWYHVHTVYSADALKQLRFMGSLNRYDDIESVLKAIEKSTNVKVKLNGNVVVVSR